MDLFNDYSDSVVSQPTQLLQYALAKATKTVENSKEWSSNQQREQQQGESNVSKDFSSDAIIVPTARDSTPHCQFKWLAPPQTQSIFLHREQELVEEDSQKENTPTSNENNLARPRSSSPQAPSGRPVKGSHTDALSHPHSRTASGTGRANAPKSVSFQSPRSPKIAQPLLQPTTSLPATSSRRHRSPSQDSFGGAMSQDPAANYVAQATQVFEVPLSDLGFTTNDLIMDDRLAHSSKSQEDEGDSWMEKIRRAYEQTKSSEADAPSHSGGSQGSSQNVSFPHPDASQLLNDEESLESIEAQRNQYGVQANASQSSLLVEEDEPSAEKKPTSIFEQLLPTQPSTPMDNTADPTIGAFAEDMYAPTSRSRSARATVGTNSTPGPRNLASLIRPDQRERRFRQLYGNAIPPQAPQASENAAMQQFGQSPSEYVDTQPSTFVVTSPSDLLSEDNGSTSHAPKQPASPHRVQLLQQHAHNIPHEHDNLDIVPDSEPPVPSTATPARDLGLNSSPTKRAFRPLSPMSENGSGEIVADSMELPGSSQDLEGDIPLAALLQVKPISKSAAEPISAKMTSSTGRSSLPPPPVPIKKPVNHQENPYTIKPKSLTRGKKNAKQESGEIPTSAPEQDLQDPTSMPDQSGTPTAINRPLKKRQRKGKAPAVSARKSIRTRVAPSAHGKKRQHPSDTEASEGETRPTLKLENQEEEETELADDEDYVDVDPARVELNATSSRKRRRIEDAKPARAVSKASTRSKNSDTPALSTRATKRLRSIVPTSRALAAQPATRVFALWRQDGHYYSGTIHSLQSSTRYLIKFDDDTEDHVDITRLRRCELRVGDAVILGHGDLRGTVADVSQLESGSVGVEVDDGSDGSSYDIQDIRVASRAILSHWKDRTLTADSIITTIRPKLLYVSPSPSKVSLMSVTSVKQKKPFAKTGFVVTLTVGNKDPEQTKDNVMLAIKRNGGTVIDDWSSIFSMEGVHSQSNKRWTVSQENFKFRPKAEFAGLERVFLLADDCNQKPKYLVALALGIPCLSHEWMRDDYLSKQISPDWQAFLLPAGFSEPLSARVSQLVDLDWGNCKEHLSDIMSNMVASKLFSDKTILCLGADFVPLPPRGGKKGSSDATKDASRIVPWIIICMGASWVEAVNEGKFASKELSAYDYIVTKDSSERPNDLPQDGITLVHVPWVKDCLIAGRLLPVDP